MPKISKAQMHEDEKKVIAALRSNPSITVEELARTFGYSKPKIYRIRKIYEKRRTQQNNEDTPLADHKTFRMFIVLAKLSDATFSKNSITSTFPEQIQTYLKEIGVTVNYSYLTHGYSDWLICITTHNIRQTKLFCKILTTRFAEYIEDINIVELLTPISIKQPRSTTLPPRAVVLSTVTH